MVLQPILYTPSPSLSASNPSRPTLKILNQLLLPHRSIYVPLTTLSETWYAIRSMQVRGAPAIAIVAALGVAVTLPTLNDSEEEEREAGDEGGDVGKGNEEGKGREGGGGSSAEEAEKNILQALDYLLTARPTAVNLADAAGKLGRVVRRAVATAASAVDADADASGEYRLSGARVAAGNVVYEAYVAAAEKMLVDDLRDNENIGRFGADWIVRYAEAGKRGGDGKGKGEGEWKGGERISVLTHCNTGSLATAGYGTALGVVRSLHARQALKHAYYTETRPYNQGSRLTGYELIHDGIPATLITDSMAAALLQRRGHPENIFAVVVGADRVSANGDTANKIGTYALAILARYHNVKFLVAAPRTTIDLNTKSGSEIVIEERPSLEMTMMKGPVIRQLEDGTSHMDAETEAVSIAAEGTQVWNPAFDVTPAALIDGIITEVGVIEKGEDGEFSLDHIFTKQESHSDPIGAKKGMPNPTEGP